MPYSFMEQTDTGRPAGVRSGTPPPCRPRHQVGEGVPAPLHGGESQAAFRPGGNGELQQLDGVLTRARLAARMVCDPQVRVPMVS